MSYYGQVEYWDQRYLATANDPPCEWYRDYAGLRHLLNPAFFASRGVSGVGVGVATTVNGNHNHHNLYTNTSALARQQPQQSTQNHHHNHHPVVKPAPPQQQQYPHHHRSQRLSHQQQQQHMMMMMNDGSVHPAIASQQQQQQYPSHPACQHPYQPHPHAFPPLPMSIGSTMMHAPSSKFPPHQQHQQQQQQLHPVVAPQDNAASNQTKIDTDLLSHTSADPNPPSVAAAAAAPPKPQPQPLSQPQPQMSTSASPWSLSSSSFPPRRCCRVLIIGCGPGTFGEDMMRDGWMGGIVNVDFSNVVIEQMKTKYDDAFYERFIVDEHPTPSPTTAAAPAATVAAHSKAKATSQQQQQQQLGRKKGGGNTKKNPSNNNEHQPQQKQPPKLQQQQQQQQQQRHRMEFVCADVTERLPFDDESFDLIICKGAADVILCGPSPRHKMAKALNEVVRVLQRGTGIFCWVTHGNPDNRLEHLEVQNRLDHHWQSVSVHVVPKQQQNHTDPNLTSSLTKNANKNAVVLSNPNKAVYVYICRRRLYQSLSNDNLVSVDGDGKENQQNKK